MLFQREHTADIVVAALVEHALLHDGTGGDHADDLALDKSFCRLWIFRLFTNGDLVAFGDKTRYVAFTAMEGNAAHRRTFLLSAISAGECEL